MNGAAQGSSFCETVFPASSLEQLFHGSISAGGAFHPEGLTALGDGETKPLQLRMNGGFNWGLSARD